MSGITMFNHSIAKEYGVDVAIFLDKTSFWIKTNLANKQNIHDGKVWTYNTTDALQILFPYWTRQNLRTVIKKCKKHDLLVVGNYNKKKYDKTAWYALTLKGLSLFPELKSLSDRMNSELLELTKGLVRTNQAIPSTKPSTKESCTFSDEDVRPSPAEPKKPKPSKHEDLDEYISIWNQEAVPVGCPPVGKNKRQLSSISKSLAVIKEKWEMALNPENFRFWLCDAIDVSNYLICKFNQRMDVCLRWEHFFDIYTETTGGEV